MQTRVQKTSLPIITFGSWFLSHINAVSIPLSLYYNPNKQTHTHTPQHTNTQQSSFNNIDLPLCKHEILGHIK